MERTRRSDRGGYFALISDGIFEQPDDSEERFGIDRIIDIVRENSTLPMKGLVEKIHQAVLAHAGKAVQDDDMTIVLVKREQN